MQRHRSSSTLLILCLLGLASCQSPTGVTTKAPGVTISFSTGSRTVVPDWGSSIAQYGITLHCTSNASQADLTRSVTAAATVSVPSVPQGTWTVSVTAYNSALVAVGTGVGSSSVTIDGNGTASSTVAVSISGAQTATGLGGYSFTFNFSTTTGIDKVTGQLLTATGTSVASPAGDLVTKTSFGTTGGYSQGRFYNTSVASGTYILLMKFYRGSTLVGAYSEAINVFDGVTSDQWVDSGGNLLPLRTFEASDFGSNNNLLASLYATSSGAALGLSPSFSSAVTGYLLTSTSSVVLVPGTSIAGESLQYQLNSTSGSWTTLASGMPLTVNPWNIAFIMVTAPDQTSSLTYTVGVLPSSNLLSNPTWVTDLSGWTVTTGGDGIARGATVLTGYDCVVTSYQWNTLAQTVSLTGAGYSTAQLDSTSTVITLRVVVGGYSPRYYLILELLDGSGSVVATANMGTSSSWLVDGGYKTLSYANTSGLAIRSARVTLGGRDNVNWAGCYGAAFYAPSLNVY